jgi:ABC-type sugar transport system substrate-binding protein
VGAIRRKSGQDDIMGGSQMSNFTRRRGRMALAALLPAVLLAATFGLAASSSGATKAALKKPPKIVIGFAAITEAAPVVTQSIASLEQGAKLLGWSVKVVNANGDPSLMASGFSSLVNEHVNAIVDLAIQPSEAQAGFKAAKAAGIPIIELGAPLIDPQHLSSVTYTPSDPQLAKLVADQMISDLHGKGSLLVLQASSQPAIVARNQELDTLLKGTGITIATTHETDLANIVSDTASEVSDALRANAKINAVWAPQDPDFAPAVQTIVNQHLGNVGVYSIYLDPIDFPLLRKHQVPMAISDSPLADCSWYALDALVNKFVLKKANWITSESIHPLPYVLVTPKNVPSGSSYPYAPFQPFFQQRWTSEGVSANA